MKTFRALVFFAAALGAACVIGQAGWAQGAEPPGEQKGVVLLDGGRYHLGDGKFNRYAADESLLAQEVVGPKYSIPFKVGMDGAVTLRIGRVIGVDTGSTLELYAGVKAGGTVYLERLEGGRLIGRVVVGLLEARHNHAAFESEAVKLKAGTYLLTVESNPYTLFDRDDIQIEEISVRTDELDLSIEPLWTKGKVYSGGLDLDLVPTSSEGEERLAVELAAPSPKLEEPPAPEGSGRGRGKEGLELDLEVKRPDGGSE